MENLTPRELQVLGLLSKGLTNNEIARELGIAFRTTRNHITNIYAKLNVGNRVEAALRYSSSISDSSPADELLSV